MLLRRRVAGGVHYDQNLAVRQMQWSDRSTIQSKTLTNKVFQANLAVGEKIIFHLSVQQDGNLYIPNKDFLLQFFPKLKT